MFDSTTAAARLRASRISLGVSQNKLARLAGVSRFKICLYELGDGPLKSEEQHRVREALQAEAERLRRAAAQIDDDDSLAKPEGVG